MKIVVIGASGVIGKAVAENLSRRHEVIRVGKTQGDYQVDIASEASIMNLFEQIGSFDALVSATGDLAFAEFSAMTTEQWYVGIQGKLMGQINLTRHALRYLPAKGSITLTSGIIGIDPIAWGTSATTVNGALSSFVKGAAIELPRGIRINVVCPDVLVESLPIYGDFFPGANAVPAEKVAKAYQKSVEGAQTGLTYVVTG